MFSSYFSTKIIRSLARKGIRIVGLTYIPGTGDLPFATGETGYSLDVQGQYQIKTYLEVVALAS